MKIPMAGKYYQHIIVEMSIPTTARMELICEDHKITLKQLVDSILECISDEELLKAVESISKSGMNVFQVGDKVVFTDECGKQRQSIITRIVPKGKYSKDEIAYAIKGTYSSYIRMAKDIRKVK